MQAEYKQLHSECSIQNLKRCAHQGTPFLNHHKMGNIDNSFGVEYHLVDSCNLRCAGCSHYSSLINEKICLPIEFIISDLSKLKEKVGNNLKWLRLLGGEPLIHPQITECLKRIRELFPNVKLLVITNGLLLDKMNQEFYDVCIRHRIGIRITDYGVTDLSPIIAKLKAIGVSVKHYSQRKEWHYQHIRLTKDVIDCFTDCPYRTTCNNYRDGKIYLCPHIAYIEYFNKKFGKQIELDETDYVSLDEVNSFDELMQKLRDLRPHFCYHYCNYYDSEHPTIGKWKRTENDINEFCLLKNE